MTFQTTIPIKHTIMKELKPVNDKPKTLQEQYIMLKEKHPDTVLLFRCGDFYETYNEDAETVSKVLGITLTSRNGKEGRKYTTTKMAGFPYHALDTYLPKLIRAGHRVAICDQLEDPNKATVHRGVTKVTPDTPTTTDNQPSKNEEEMTQEQEKALRAEYENKIEAVKNAAKQKDIEIATATVKALGSNIPSQLNDHLASAIGKLELIKIKNRLNIHPFSDEMNYLITMAQKALDAENSKPVTGFSR